MKYIFVLLLLSQTLFSQNISIYFNQTVDNSACSYTNASRAINPEDTICKLINSADSLLDIAIWDNGSDKIVTALNNAYLRGVQVRYITSSNSLNTALGGLNAAIPVVTRQSLTETMHNKFIVVDKAVLLTGSMNFGEGSMFNDFNNFLIINDAPLANNYITEFNEMWGSTEAQPNLANSKFGAAKTDNTLHSFTIAGTQVESYFSPSDGTTAKIVTAINSADYTIDFCMFTFINNDLGDAVVAAKNRGVTVRGIIENVSYFGSEYNSLLSAGISVLSHANTAYDLHHKYCVIDAQQAQSNPTVVTGSHNWSNSAEDDYDENTLIIHNSDIAGQYFEEFTQRYNELNTYISPNRNNSNTICPEIIQTGSSLSVRNNQNIPLSVNIMNMAGLNLFSLQIDPFTSSIIPALSPGIYIIQTTSRNESCVNKVVVLQK